MLGLLFAALISFSDAFEEYEAAKVSIAQTYETDEYDYADIVNVCMDEDIVSIRLVLWSKDMQGIHRPYVCYTHFTNFGHPLGQPIALDEDTVQVYDSTMPADVGVDRWYLVGVFRRFKVKEIRYWKFSINEWKNPRSGVVEAGNFPAIPKDKFIWTEQHEKLYRNKEV